MYLEAESDGVWPAEQLSSDGLPELLIWFMPQVIYVSTLKVKELGVGMVWFASRYLRCMNTGRSNFVLGQSLALSLYMQYLAQASHDRISKL